MNKVIVTTTINRPTKALMKYANMKDWTLVIVGDKKTPHDLYESFSHWIYLSPEYQEKMDNNLSNLIGWNCIQRRNFGFIYAYNYGADIIATIDDDNIPYDSWENSLVIDRKVITNEYFSREYNRICDPISVTGIKKLWHRGYPIQELKNKNKISSLPEKALDNFDAQAGFWNGNPDIDAICRMEHNPTNIRFRKRKFPFCFSIGEFSPFNSQNTFIKRDALKDYFMFPHIGRMDDIWASYFFEFAKHRVVYTKPTVYQERNEHNLTKDFENEILGYRKTNELLDYLYRIRIKADIEEAIDKCTLLPERTRAAYRQYRENFK